MNRGSDSGFVPRARTEDSVTAARRVLAEKLDNLEAFDSVQVEVGDDR